MAPLLGDLAGQHGADRAVHIAHLGANLHRAALFDGRRGLRDEALVERAVEAVVLSFAVVDIDARPDLRLEQEPAEVHAMRLPVIFRAAHVQPV